MKLRRLELKDAFLMLEWMHDRNVVENLRTDFQSKTIDDCICFIKNSWSDTVNWNKAIVDENDVYMGTVSLKNINKRSAEFGITICRNAMGKGYAFWAMQEALRIAFEDKNIEQVYWCVSPENKRAVKFYDKNGFSRIESNKLEDVIGYTSEQIDSYIWYEKIKEQ